MVSLPVASNAIGVWGNACILSIIVSFSKVSGAAQGLSYFGILERYMRLERNPKTTYVKNADTAVDSKRSR